MGFTDWGPGETGPASGGPQCVYMAWHERQREVFWKGDSDCAAPNISQTSYVWLTTCVLCQITVPEVDGDEGPPEMEAEPASPVPLACSASGSGASCNQPTNAKGVS